MLKTRIETCTFLGKPMPPLTVIDLLVVHELDLRYRNHLIAFWNEVDEILPDYRERTEWLRVRGAELGI